MVRGDAGLGDSGIACATDFTGPVNL